MVKFVQGYYVLLISKRKKVGAIAGHNIYTVEEISYLRIAPQTAKFPSATYADENRCESWPRAKMLAHLGTGA